MESKMQFPLVSIVINNFNYGRFLVRAIESALAQTYENVEVIVVDDGSTDESRGILEGFRDRASIILKENSGQAGAFNVGIKAAQGLFTLLLDSDDYLLPEAVATCVARFPAGYSRVYYRLRTVNETDAVLSEVGDPGHFRAFDGDIFQAIQ
jgi:glycosyltransferase involved in cell wall biosynthesis